MVKKDEAHAFTKLVELVEGIEIAMLTTVEPDGSLHSRPMWTQKAPFDGKLAFFTRDHSRKVDEVQRDAHVCLSYSDPKRQRYVSITGTARVVYDKGRMSELWNPMYRAWFPQGLDDPELTLLEVQVQEAEYWDTHKASMVHLLGLAKAAITRKPASPGDHQLLHFSSTEPPSLQ
jgi:general stress protein 26